MKNVFSIGIPAFKSKHLFECVSSILNQSYGDFELIIVNDCSPHSVDKVVLKFNDARIRYFINEKRIGGENVAKNYNKCLSLSNGNLFILMGDDDKIEPNYLEEICQLISKYPDLDVYHCRSKIIDEKSNPIVLTPSWPEYETVYENMWHRINQKREQFISDFVFRTSPLKEKGGFYPLPLGWGSDDITAYIAMKDKGIAHTNKILLNYRRHSNSISESGSWELKIKATAQMEKWMREFLKDRPKKKEDFLIYDNIKENIKKQMEKQKIYLFAYSLRGKLFKNIAKCIIERNKIGISIREIFYSIIIYLSHKKSRII